VTVLTAYAAYIGAEELGVSGVLGAVAAGLYGGWHANSTLDADTRLSGLAFWEVLTFALNATLFVLLGTQFPFILEELDADVALTELLGAGLLVALTVAVVRILWLLLPDPGLGDSTADRLAVGWAGMRGAISLAAALSIPLAVPERPEILFLTVVVILLTLVGPGPDAARRGQACSGCATSARGRPEEAIARLEAAQSALDRLDELEDEGATEEQLRRLRDLYRGRFRQCQAVLTGEGDDGRAAAVEPRMRYSVLRKELIGVERETLVALRNAGRLRPGRPARRSSATWTSRRSGCGRERSAPASAERERVAGRARELDPDRLGLRVVADGVDAVLPADPLSPTPPNGTFGATTR
jgi:CPA1 family monovalent cation:H+ antiporter